MTNAKKATVTSSATIYVQSITGNKIPVVLDLTVNTVKDAKQKVFEQEGIKADQQRLIFGGKMLEDENKLSFYSIEENQTIHLVLRIVGGI